jgi:hypothetical protein
MEIAEDDGLAQFHQWLCHPAGECFRALPWLRGRLTGQERRFICTELQLQLLAFYLHIVAPVQCPRTSKLVDTDWHACKQKSVVLPKGSRFYWITNFGPWFQRADQTFDKLKCTAATSATRNKALRQRASNASNRYRQG